MGNIFHLVYSLCFYDKSQLNYNQISEGGKNGKKSSVLKGLKGTLARLEPWCSIHHASIQTFSTLYRFMTELECENSCKHDSKIVRAKIVCSLPKHNGLECIGNQNGQKVAKWYFDRSLKICKPFYYKGCGGNENRFDSWDECEEKCPNTFPPEVELLNKVIHENRES